MIDQQSGETPLVSVIIPSYNYGHYLHDAIESVLQQEYPSLEIVVVDDGSVDGTKEVAMRYLVKYVYQPNQGISAARNTGVANSSGEFIIFLDADDWLAPGGVERNLKYLLQDETLAFVSGAHYKIYNNGEKITEEIHHIESDYYCSLLRRNYIGMPAAVTFRRWVFDEFDFDPAMHGCEEYDLFLKIARKYPILHHTEKVASYRIHATSVSRANIPLMLNTAMLALEHQAAHLKTEKEKEAYAAGKAFWIDYYWTQLYEDIASKKTPVNTVTLKALVQHNPQPAWKYVRSNLSYVMQSLGRKSFARFLIKHAL